ncbi:FAD-binding domain-containing protein [Trematosphaeria pertusa]|uniref:Delta(24)-sterol reductase n=1 Tax=Trematosphaeria pertusa TaxID=390896 RepID=A0A6A6IXE2_9PLEO|nr:FAD-binding domain-containing protein [Trematosphaeria pertusa]KAF2255159.1 FAD-binding domain-containing protein [Trematosphaeria pertusa]
MDAHERAVDVIRTQTRHFYDTKTPFRVYHGSTNSTRHTNFDRNAIVDISSLNHILSIDPAKKTALVEPNVPMDVLVRESARVGLLPPVVMEFPGITVGGGFVGTAGESSSFKHGFFDRTVLSAEVVLASGDLVTASDASNQELFDGLRGSFGTLGVLTMVEMRLIEMSKYVELTYHPTTSIKEAMTKLQEETQREGMDFIDGILFSKGSGVIVTGRLADTASSSNVPLQRFSRPWDEWFWIHAKSVAFKKSPSTELVPIQDYLFRYDRGAFWTGMYAFKHFMVPFTRLTRFLLDYFFHTRIMYHALHVSGHTDRYIIQDVAFPAGNAAAFAEFVDENFGIYPLWLCPLRKDARASMGQPRDYQGAVQGKEPRKPNEGEYINIGVWGPYPSSEDEYLRANRSFEAKVRALGGLKWLYARVFYTEEEWWQIYDKEKHETLREKYKATSLPTVWDKVKDRVRIEELESGVKGWLKRTIKSNDLLSGFYGVYKAMGGGDYLLKRETA